MTTTKPDEIDRLMTDLYRNHVVAIQKQCAQILDVPESALAGLSVYPVLHVAERINGAEVDWPRIEAAGVTAETHFPE